MTRIDRLLSIRGYGSRKDVRALIKAGEVLLNGRVVTDPAEKVDIDKDTVSVGGQELARDRHIYIMMNKPAGVLCASRDKRSKTVIDLLPEEIKWRDLFPAGRLDKDTEGFVLITDDGDFAHRMLAPSKHVSKTYEAVVDKPLSPAHVEAFEAGLVLSDGTAFLPAKIRQISGERESGQYLVEIVLYEGKYHQIKRMLAAVGLGLIYLKRTKMGGLELDPCLEKGESRLISAEELERIFAD